MLVSSLVAGLLVLCSGVLFVIHTQLTNDTTDDTPTEQSVRIESEDKSAPVLIDDHSPDTTVGDEHSTGTQNDPLLPDDSSAMPSVTGSEIMTGSRDDEDAPPPQPDQIAPIVTSTDDNDEGEPHNQSEPETPGTPMTSKVNIYSESDPVVSDESEVANLPAVVSDESEIANLPVVDPVIEYQAPVVKTDDPLVAG